MTALEARPSPTAAPACPPNHVSYLSSMLADNAVTLHGYANPHCQGFMAFACGDHHHVGHTSPEVGNRCKAITEQLRDERRQCQGRR